MKKSKSAKRKARKSAEHTGRGSAVRPTPERKRRGEWAEPTGTMKAEQPAVDMAADMVGLLYHRKLINVAQEQAARAFQAARADYLSELPDIAGYKSCIAGSIPGYDDGDGDPAIIARYRALEALVGRGRTILLSVCEEGRVPSVAGLHRLRAALDAISGVAPRKKIA